MHDDEMMDGLLTQAMATAAPSPGPGFDAAVMRRLRPRRLSRQGRVAMVAYGMSAAAATAWLMRDLPPATIGTGLTVVLAMGVAASAYARRLVSRA